MYFIHPFTHFSNFIPSGATIKNHGGYNSMCFLLILIPFFVIYSGTMALAKAIGPSFWKYFKLILTTITIVLALRIIYVR